MVPAISWIQVRNILNICEIVLQGLKRKVCPAATLRMEFFNLPSNDYFLTNFWGNIETFIKFNYILTRDIVPIHVLVKINTPDFLC